MKKLPVLIISLVAAVSVLAADWPGIFKNLYAEKGLDEAVVTSLRQGYTADQIVKAGLDIENLAEEKLVKSLFCALVPLETVHKASTGNNIPEETVTKGYELALEECPDAMEERIKVSAPISGAPQLSPEGGGSGFASPSTFQ